MSRSAVMSSSVPLIRAWSAIIMGGIFYCYQFILRVSPNVMTDELMLTFGIDAGILAFVVSIYYYGYAGMQIPLGVLMDKLGPRRIIAAAAIICGIATYLFAISQNVYFASFARLLIGVGSACGYLGTLKLGSQWFPRKKMPHIVGIAILLGTAGASLGTLPLEYLLNLVGLHKSLMLLSFFGILLGFTILLFINKTPPKPASVPEDQHLLEDLFKIIKMPQAWLISIFGMLMYIPLTIFGDLWGVSFLESKYGITESLSAIAMTSMFIGVGIGGPIFAWITNSWCSRKKPMVLGAVVTLLIYSMILFMPQLSFPVICILFFLAGLFFNGQCMSFSSICEIMPEHASGVAVGFLNMLVMANGFIFLPVVGRILVALWDGQISHDVPVYSATNFQIALSIIPVCLSLSLVLLKFIKDTYHHVHS